MYRLLVLFFFIITATGISAGEMHPVSEGVPAFIITNDDTTHHGEIIGFKEGFVYLQMPKEIVRFSPKDFKGIYFSKKAAHTAKAFFRLYEITTKNPSLNYSHFLRATIEATRIVHRAVNQNDEYLLKEIVNKARKFMEKSNALIEPRKFTAVLAIALIPLDKDKADKAVAELEQYKSRAEKKLDKQNARSACEIADTLIMLIKSNIR